MRLTSHGHACVRLDSTTTRVVVDPGGFSDVASALHGATAVLLTHQHPDHLDVEHVTAALHADPDLDVWGPAGALDLLDDVDAHRKHAVEPGDILRLGAAQVEVGGGRHAVIHPDVPVIANRTYTVELDGTTVHHPGDSLDVPGRDLDVLLLPVAAPWLRLADAMDAARAAGARSVVPVHDAILSTAGQGLVDRLLDTARVGGEYVYRRPRVGEAWTP
ncbi:MBL fold metallo-hydrolase [Isoptericola chiayiensis]|uniref:MBL fold metallo-hydrolase n=1 Tax=Isoptericola chiayiensis TaxID=579446 RepID=A0ABP8YFP6_9MICO|nr:L-ascorbate metabolism protein UlaG (beta-lactamase superfamily) [Isoptericola chiayiensis]